MAFSAVPFDESGNLLPRWFRTTLFPIQAGRCCWDAVYRGESLLAPLGFAYMWILLTLPLLGLAIQLGLRATRLAAGAQAAQFLAPALARIPAVLGLYLGLPILALLAGLVGHGLLCAVASPVRGHGRASLRAVLYGLGWLMPGLALAGSLHLHLMFTLPAGSAAATGLNLTPVLAVTLPVLVAGLALAGLALLAWGLLEVHRIPLWKTGPAALLIVAGLCAAGSLLLAQEVDPAPLERMLNPAGKQPAKPTAQQGPSGPPVDLMAPQSLGSAIAPAEGPAAQTSTADGPIQGPAQGAISPRQQEREAAAALLGAGGLNSPEFDAARVRLLSHRSTQVATSQVKALAEAGLARAMDELGLRYYNGWQDLPRNQVLGVEWLVRAYEHGSREADSCSTLAEAYSHGWGAAENQATSRIWQNRSQAIANGQL